MKKFLLSILLAILAISANAQFKASINMSPGGGRTPRVIRFNFADVCKQLGANYDEFARKMNLFQSERDRDFSLYLLTDANSEWYRGGGLTTDGRRADMETTAWTCSISLPGPETNVLVFEVDKWRDPITDRWAVKEGDVCHAAWALEYQGGIATFDITVNITNEMGTGISLNNLEKVGEQTLSARYTDYHLESLRVDIDLEEIAAKFDSSIKWGNLELYAMTDAREMLIGNYSTYDTPAVCLNIDGTANDDWQSENSYFLSLFSGKCLLIGTGNAEVLGGQSSSGSVFLVADGKYYELILDIQFEKDYEDLEPFDIVATEPIGLQLMYTKDYFTFFDEETGRLGLVSTDIDVEKARELTGAQNPVLYAEKRSEDGNLLMTRHYSAAPGQGFWFVSEGGQCFYNSNLGHNTPLGMYCTDDTFKWYENPISDVYHGDKYQVNLYLANPENGKAVKYEISVEIVKELQTESVAYVRSLPVGLTGSPNGIERPTPSPSRNGGEFYDLQGRRLMKAPEKGLYIQDGVLRMK
jgi:hypothetical protein